VIISGFTVAYSERKNLSTKLIVCSDDFYFVHITDTHVMHKIFDRNEIFKNRLESVLNKVRSFDNEPAFVVISGDLVEWGGFGLTGALNCISFVNCFYKREEQLYLDSDCTVPVYTTPGNHDYRWGTKLSNYHRFIDPNHVEDKDRYVIDYENLSLFFLDSGHDYLLNPFEWVRSDGLHVKGSGLCDDSIIWLNSSLNSCESIHKIVLMHNPAISERDGFGKMLDVLARNREEFIELCEYHDVDVVLTGHTHRGTVFDGGENMYNGLLNCSMFSTLYVNTNDCKTDCAYRNITILGNDIWLEPGMTVFCDFS
jgi:3',5'-cyclic AMP phosphodiesterase CpdA